MHHRTLRNMCVSRWPKPALYQATLYYCRCHCTLQLGHSLADRFVVSVDWLQSDAVVLRTAMICISTHLLITPPLGRIWCPAKKWGDMLGLDHQEEFQQSELGHVQRSHEQPVDKPASEQT